MEGRVGEDRRRNYNFETSKTVTDVFIYILYCLLVLFSNELCVRFVYLETFENEVILSSYDTKLSLEFHVGGVD